MAARRRDPLIREQARGVGLVVALGLGVCLTGLLVMAVFVWVMT